MGTTEHCKRTLGKTALCPVCHKNAYFYNTASACTICTAQAKIEQEREKKRIKQELQIETQKKEAEELLKLATLTEKQKEFLELYKQGLREVEIAKQLGVSRQCVSNRLMSIRKKAEHPNDIPLTKLPEEKRKEVQTKQKHSVTMRRYYATVNVGLPYEEYQRIYEEATKCSENPLYVLKRVIKECRTRGLRGKKMYEELPELVAEAEAALKKERLQRKNRKQRL